jgi:D-serine deaminase-like pyridoxal phosphate-dependent protein
VAALSEEHGIIDLTASPWRPAVGERLRIIPNHACVVSNMVDAVWTLRDGALADQWPVAARGRVT